MSVPSESIRRYSLFFKKQSALKVLDYGTGTLRNAVYLSRQGFRVHAADVPEQLERLQGCPALKQIEQLLAVDELRKSALNVDLVLSTYVFNIIMSREERRLYIENIAANLRPGGFLLMEVRCPRLDERCGPACEDFFSCDTCSKTLTHEELDTLLNPVGLRRISHYYREHALAAVYQYGTLARN
ncbi:class I SAM-dependent methyltransferase [Geomesophilobacter sediminis]|uniref:Class I SAM-dependent methyltransferase n=1 Tax=Geomesophilobacter sediminis TaxID=2798584 RepID=A0A8J7JFM4_9BACT|nr:class I SAM-dependent methyltransferase [Geomesophilobacter sediminis]MBJ6725154.1 class I SAM-dependent methyltransferase [Geomesophilobacter sediminis]